MFGAPLSTKALRAKFWGVMENLRVFVINAEIQEMEWNIRKFHFQCSYSHLESYIYLLTTIIVRTELVDTQWAKNKLTVCWILIGFNWKH